MIIRQFKCGKCSSVFEQMEKEGLSNTACLMCGSNDVSVFDEVLFRKNKLFCPKMDLSDKNDLSHLNDKNYLCNSSC